MQTELATMTLRAAAFVDIPRQYKATALHRPGKRINYERLYSLIKDEYLLLRAYAFGAQIKDEAQKFIETLKKIGYNPNYQQATLIHDKANIGATDCSMKLAIEATKFIGRVDAILIGSDDTRLIPLVQHLRNNGIKVVVMGVFIPEELKQHCDDCVEFPEILYEDSKKGKVNGHSGEEQSAIATNANTANPE